MSIVGGLDIHRKQITFDYLDTVTGQVRRVYRFKTSRMASDLVFMRSATPRGSTR